MGFGLLCVGYLTLLLFRVIPIEPIGFYLMTAALDKLEKQNRAFRAAKIVSAVMFFESIFGAFLWIDRRCGLNLAFLADDRIDMAEQAVYYVGLAVFYLLLFRGIAAISRQVGYDKGKNAARVLTAAACVFYAAQLVSVIPSIRAYMTLPLVLFQLLFMIGTLRLLFSCYRLIVTDEMLEKEEMQYREFLEKNRKKAPKPDLHKKSGKGETFKARRGK